MFNSYAPSLRHTHPKHIKKIGLNKITHWDMRKKCIDVSVEIVIILCTHMFAFVL